MRTHRRASLAMAVLLWRAGVVLVAAGQDSIAEKSAAPLLAVARLITYEKWNSHLDEFVNALPAGKSLGDRWQPLDARWQQARRLVDTRVGRILDAYERSGELSSLIASELGSIGADRRLLAAALDSAAGPGILRFFASTQYVSTTMADDPKGPRYGDPGWMDQMRALRKRFDERIGPGVPPADTAHIQEVQQFVSSPAGQQCAGLWGLIVGKATARLDAAINLMLFDDREAIDRETARMIAKSQ
jgi:hypothetical protein